MTENNKELKWTVVHDCDDDNGNPTCWAANINSQRYGKYAWINDISNTSNKTARKSKKFNVEVYLNGFVELTQLKTLESAKKWVESVLIQ